MSDTTGPDWSHLSNEIFRDFVPPAHKRLEIGFEQISLLEAKITYLTERLGHVNVKGSKRQKADRQLAQYQVEHEKLRSAHEAGATVLRQKALALSALPREMRDAIFEQIYVKKHPIEVTYIRHGNQFVYEMPKDTALYMSALHVGETLAREAAEVFYKYNTFTFIRGPSIPRNNSNSDFGAWNKSQLEEWFATDHHGSNVTPSEHVRNLEIRCDRLGYYFDGAALSNWRTNTEKCCNHIAFEELIKGIPTDSVHDYRERLRSLSRYPTLKHVHFEVTNRYGRFDALARMLNPIVRELRDIGKKVTLAQQHFTDHVEYSDLSSIFDDPTDKDYAEYYQITQRDSVFKDDPNRDIFDTWEVIDVGHHACQDMGENIVNAFMPTDSNIGFMRVWLAEHHEMCKFMARDFEIYKTVDALVMEYKQLSAEERSLRRRFYPRILAHCRG